MGVFALNVKDVAQKGADGNWKIVEEHLSAMPTPPKAKLPVVKEWTAPAATPAAPAPAKPAETPAKPK